MEEIGGKYNEINPYESFTKIQGIIEDKINSYKFDDEKLCKIKDLINIFKNLEDYLNPDDPDNYDYIEENLGNYFKDLISELSCNYLFDLEPNLKQQL